MSIRTIAKTGWTFQNAGQGQDTLWGSAAFARLPIGTPGNDVLKGTSRIDSFYGGPGNDTIYGYAGNDALSGQSGNDKLYGGKGADSFFFDTKLSATKNIDRIMDFKHLEDRINLNKIIFKKLTPGPLVEAEFHVGRKAHDADDRIIYDKRTGTLYYDPDGTGAAAKIKFAVLANKATLSHLDFAVI